jgi:hypothetical protein
MGVFRVVIRNEFITTRYCLFLFFCDYFNSSSDNFLCFLYCSLCSCVHGKIESSWYLSESLALCRKGASSNTCFLHGLLSRSISLICAYTHTHTHTHAQHLPHSHSHIGPAQNRIFPFPRKFPLSVGVEILLYLRDNIVTGTSCSSFSCLDTPQIVFYATVMQILVRTRWMVPVEAWECVWLASYVEYGRLGRVSVAQSFPPCIWGNLVFLLADRVC